MTKKAPGRNERNGMSLVDAISLFPNDKAAEEWFIKMRWPNGVHCPYCESDNVQTGAKHKTMPFRCREKHCAKRFSVKTRTVMQASNLGYQKWALAIYLLCTSLKSVSSMKLHRDLGITQKSAWHLAHRIRKALEHDTSLFSGPVEVDETYFGGKEKNRSLSKRGKSKSEKAIVVGAKDRATRKVSAKLIEHADRPTLTMFVEGRARPDAMIYTDDHPAYRKLKNPHESVTHSVSEYVRG